MSNGYYSIGVLDFGFCHWDFLKVTMRVLVIYGKDPTALLREYEQRMAPANFLYGLPLFHEHGITAEAFRSFEHGFFRWAETFVTRRISQDLSGFIRVARLPFVIRRYEGVIVVNHDVVIAVSVIRILFAPRTKLYFIDDRAERMVRGTWLRRALIRMYDVLIPYSRDQLALTKKMFHAHAEVAYWGSDCSFFVREDHREEPFVLSVGGDAGRDFETLLAAATALPAIPFIIIGRKSQLAGTAVPPNVAVRYSVEISAVRDYYRKAHLVVIPLLKEETERDPRHPGSLTSGVTSLGDCICLGKAVVISGMRWVGEYVRAGVDAEVVSCEDAPALTHAIERLWNDEPYRTRLGDNLYRLRDKFSIHGWVRQVSAIIKRHENLLSQ